MSTYNLGASGAKAIGVLLTTGSGSETLLLHRPANDLCAQLHLEPNGRTLTATILLGHQRSSLTLQDGDGANQLTLIEQIEAIANGTADTAETGAIGTPSPPAREDFALCEDDEASLRHLVRIGGTRHLHCGASITVHNALQSTQRHAWVTTPNGTSPLQAGTPGELYVAAAQHIEAALNAA